ncbi:MAG TPA: rod shape-determining protein MreC [Candidatus Paceibacterota bacterium]|jgi:cell shape-determining protein MreC|nr:rod shape-determining protein MreC [Candidatus Paceibacterota bacterium]
MAIRQTGTPQGTGRGNLFFATLIAILIVLINMATGGKISSLARDVVAPISNIGGKIGEDITQNGYFSSRRALEAQIAALQNEVQQEQLQAAAFSALEQRDTSLSALEHLAQTAPGLAAPITSSIVSSPYGTFTIGAGSADYVLQGAMVLSDEGFVVGKVVQVQSHRSLVAQIFASRMQTTVSIDGAAVVASGEGGEAEAQVPHGIVVSQGDPAIAPEYDDRPIGIVQHVDSNPANAQQAVYIALPISLASLEYVYVTP